MRNRFGKVGMLTMALMLAVGTMGAAFASFTDTLLVEGYVDVANLEWEVEELSGTFVFKDMETGFSDVAETRGAVWAWEEGLTLPDDGVASIPDGVPESYELVSWAAADWDGDDLLTLEFHNIFPCIDFCGDVIVHYTGSIPAHIALGDIEWDAEGMDLSQYLEVSYQIWDEGEQVWVDFAEEDVQLHDGDMLRVWFCLHIPQDNDLQGDGDGDTWEAEFQTWLQAYQWDGEAEDPNAA